MRVGWLVNERELDSLTCLCACPPCPETEKRLREVVASRRLSAAPLPWPYETHPRGGTRFPPSATPVAVVADPAATSPGSLFLSRKRGCSSGLRSLSPRSCSRSAHFLSLSSSSLSYVPPCRPHPNHLSHSSPSPPLSLFRFALSVTTLSAFLPFLFRELHLRAGFLPPSLPSRLLNFPPENHAINVRPGNCTPLGSDVVVDRGALAPDN